jgi:membrane glycosyltransferase
MASIVPLAGPHMTTTALFFLMALLFFWLAEAWRRA